MVNLSAILWTFLSVHHVVKGQHSTELPSWISNDPVVQNPLIVDSAQIGHGSLKSVEVKDLGWSVVLNDEIGYGAEIEVEKLSLNLDSDDHLLIVGWPITTDGFKEIKLLTGNFTKSQKLYIPNTKMFLVLFKASKSRSPELVLSYKRYGVSLEIKNPTTEHPIKKDTLYEIQFSGLPPEDYLNAEISKKVKEAIRATAERYCQDHQIDFEKNKPTDEMVLIKRVSYCPFEWVDRDNCASIQHSVFVSGLKISGENVIMNYELTADHLKDMWAQTHLPEMEKIHIKIYKVPDASEPILWWFWVVLLVTVTSTLGIFLFWRFDRFSSVSRRLSAESRVPEVKTSYKKNKMTLARHQKIPSFMETSAFDKDGRKFADPVLQSMNIENSLKDKVKDAEKPRPPTEFEMKNYFGSVLFSNNKAFEEDEPISETHPK